MNGQQIQDLLLKEGISPATVEHRNEQRIKLFFKNTAKLTAAVKQVPGRRWSKTMNAWHIPKDKKLLELLIKTLNSKAQQSILPVPVHAHAITVVSDSVLKLNHSEYAFRPYVEKLTDKLMLKAYSQNTIRHYQTHFTAFLKAVYGLKEIDSITKEEIEKYLLWRLRQKNYSESDQNQHINAIKFYYEQVLGRARMLFYLPRPTKPKKLPTVWAEEDVVKMIRAMHNLKHRTMLLMTYAHGMRVSEIANLKLADMDSKRMQIHIKGGKGKKDRIVNLSEASIHILKAYYKKYKPKVYLFENDLTGAHITMRTIQEVFQFAKKKAGLIKKAGIHSLRHSYATHLHEQGIDIKFLKELLGHSSLKTTETYTHVSKREISNIKSPLDRLKI